MNTFNISRGVSGGVCTLLTIVILLLLLYNKSYKSALQRMFLYLTSTTILLEVFFTIQIERQFHYPGQEQFCSALGFFVEASGGISYMFTMGITIVSLYTVYKQLWRRDPLQRVTKSRWLRITLETSFVIFGIISILIVNSIPFAQGNYGLTGPFCWIRSFDENCTVVGLQEQLAFYVIADILSVANLAAAVILAIVYCRIACKYKAVRNKQRKLVRQTLILMCFLSTHVLTIVITGGVLVGYITNTTGSDANYVLWLMNSVGIPISLMVIPVGFLVYLNSGAVCGIFRKLYKKVHYEGCLRAFCMKKNRNIGEDTEQLNTNPSSHPVNVPSYTYWSVPYTGEFTNISEPAMMDDMEQ